MESESNQSLLSRRQSELGSRYMVESGVFMSAFAATIFVAGLVTVGVLMLASVVALSVMLNSCQSRDSGVFQLFRTDDHYCHLLAFHSELNNLEFDQLPTSCRQEGVQYLNDLNLTIQLVEVYFTTLKANGDGLDVILVDGDDILLPDSTFSRRKNVEEMTMRNHARLLILRLYMNLQASGWSLICFTRKHVGEWNATVESLNDAGIDGWNSLIMRSDDELLMESWKYISHQRMQLVERGFRITGLVSSQMDAFRGSNLGQRNFKLANPTYYHLPN